MKEGKVYVVLLYCAGAGTYCVPINLHKRMLEGFGMNEYREVLNCEKVNDKERD